jgi:methionyl-tRNA formyltransferase
MKIVVASSKLWDSSLKEKLSQKLGCDIALITQKDELNLAFLNEYKPDVIFFPHWSYILKPEIYNSFKCIMFHMTDLPYGRGGSPLQNLIVRGHKSTKISAFLCDGGLDTGPIYLKKDLDLAGTAQEIFERASKTILEMIEQIVKLKPAPVPQSGEVTEFKRRKPEDGDLKNLSNLEEVYNYIRMLDGEGYPRAFIETKDLKYEFSDARLVDGKVEAKVVITRKGENS